MVLRTGGKGGEEEREGEGEEEEEGERERSERDLQPEQVWVP